MSGADRGDETTARLGPAIPLRETAKALLVRLKELDDKEVWIPKSVIHDDSECYSMKSGEGVMIIEAWWGEKEGLC